MKQPETKPQLADMLDDSAKPDQVQEALNSLSPETIDKLTGKAVTGHIEICTPLAVAPQADTNVVTKLIQDQNLND